MPGKDGRGDFFAVDRRSFAFVCSLGLNAAVAYLLLARGTGVDHATSSWSVNSVEKYTSIGRKRAGQAVALLIEARAAEYIKRGIHPRYYLARAWEIDGAEGYRKPLDVDEKAVLSAFQAGKPPPDKQKGFGPVGHWTARPVCSSLAQKKYLRRKLHDEHGKKFNSSDQSTAQYELADPPVSEWIWLPNTLVDSAGDEDSPIELMRQTGNVAWLRLFIELYQAQDLVDDGSIPWRKGGFWWSFTRTRIGQSGRHVVFAFEPERMRWDGLPAYVAPLRKMDASGECDDSEIFSALEQLESFGLVQQIGLLVESGDLRQTEVMHSCALPGGDGLECERAVTRDAYDAALQFLNKGQRMRAEGSLLMPVESHRADVQLIGVARLRYLPKTAMTSRWFSETAGRCELWSARYRALENDALLSTERADMQYQEDCA